MSDWKETLFVWKGIIDGIDGEMLYCPHETVIKTVISDLKDKMESPKGAVDGTAHVNNTDSDNTDWDGGMMSPHWSKWSQEQRDRLPQTIDFGSALKFSGSWLGSASSSDASSPLHKSNLLSDNPTDNPNTFALKADVTAQSDSYLVFNMKGGYKLDNGGGHENYEDVSHTLVVRRKIVAGDGVIFFDKFGEGWNEHGPNHMLAAARGMTEFGPFVSLGFVSIMAGEPAKLTLCRRYTEDDDMRSEKGVNDEDFLCGMLERIGGESIYEVYGCGRGEGMEKFGEFIERNLPLLGTRGEGSEGYLENIGGGWNKRFYNKANNDKEVVVRKPVEERARKRTKKE